MKRLLALSLVLLLLTGCALQPAQPHDPIRRDREYSRVIWAVRDDPAAQAEVLSSLGYQIEEEDADEVKLTADPDYTGEPKPRIYRIWVRRVREDDLARRIGIGSIDLAVTAEPEILLAAQDAGWSLYPRQDGSTLIVSPRITDYDSSKTIPESLICAGIAE